MFSTDNFVRHVKSLGFVDEEEFHRLVASVPIKSPSEQMRYADWLARDGSKAGLLELIPDPSYRSYRGGVVAVQHSYLATVPEVTIIGRKRQPKPRELVGKVLQLGAGRQSSAIAEMVVEGELPRIDLAVFADTGDEPSWVYKQVWYLAERLESVGIPLVVVQKKNARGGIVEHAKTNQHYRFASMPLFTGFPGEPHGILQRQCTKEWKVEPCGDYVRGWLLERGYAYRRSGGGRVVKPSVYIEQWYGIAADELYRVKRRGPGWQQAVYPLVKLGLKTADIMKWYRRRGLPVPRKSSCRVCPYHDDQYWLMLKTRHPEDFAHACEFDEWLRSDEARYLNRMVDGREQQCYLHRSCIPLREVDFQAEIERKRQGKVHPLQQELFGSTCSTDGGFSCFS